MSSTVLITGAAAGIGRATALRLANDGWHCVLVDAHAVALKRLQADWPTDAPTPLGLVADLTDARRIEDLANEVPLLDALINNAGMSAGGANALTGHEDGKAARLLALNLAAPARMVQACAARLKPEARIVNVASGAGLRAIPWRGLYSPSKAGLIAQTRALSRAKPDWTVTALSPGFVRTELVQGLIESGRLNPAQALAKVPLGRMAEPEDIAEALRFLVSPGARPLTGQLLVLDGGSSVCGGSMALPVAIYEPMPLGLPLVLRCQNIVSSAWRAALQDFAPGYAAAYPAVLDGAALDAAPGTVLDTVLHSARSFRSIYDGNASLTLLLPSSAEDTAWELAGDMGATRMLIATLAAEWGAHGLRINALQVSAKLAPVACLPLLDYLAGARAQYLTGQVFEPGTGLSLTW